MSKDLVPSKPNTFPDLIARKLDNLSEVPRKSDLEVIRELLDVDQEERVVSDKEVQRLKNLEKKTYANQNKYKKLEEQVKKSEKCSVFFFLFYILPLMLCHAVFKRILDEDSRKIVFKVLSCWLINLIAVVIYLYQLYGSHLGLRFGSSKPVEHNVFDNEGCYWQGSMTSTELKSKQKTIVNSWEQILKVKPLLNYILSIFAFLFHIFHILYFFVRFAVIHEIVAEKSTVFFNFSFLTEPLLIYYLFDYIFSFLFLALFVVQMFVGMSQRDEVSPSR
ncbi:unnamed protein product [Caenorhabditis brenneri]